MKTEIEIIKLCQQNDPIGQKALYDKFSRTVYGICLRYAKDEMNANDMLQDSFIKLFNKIDAYQFKGSFEGWLKRVAVNVCLDSLRKSKKNSIFIDDYTEKKLLVMDDEDALQRLSAQEITDQIQKLPDGYRAVFNLFAIEGYGHKEIAEMLDISESTSKTQYRKARRRLQEMLLNINFNSSTRERAV